MRKLQRCVMSCTLQRDQLYASSTASKCRRRNTLTCCLAFLVSYKPLVPLRQRWSTRTEDDRTSRSCPPRHRRYVVSACRGCRGVIVGRRSVALTEEGRAVMSLACIQPLCSIVRRLIANTRTRTPRLSLKSGEKRGSEPEYHKRTLSN